VIGCQDRLKNDLHRVGWDGKPYLLNHSFLFHNTLAVTLTSVRVCDQERRSNKF